MNKKQRNLRLTDAEYEAVKRMLKDGITPPVSQYTPDEQRFVDLALKWYRATMTIQQVSKDLPPDFLKPVKTNFLEPDAPQAPAPKRPGFGIPVEDFLAGFKHQPCPDDDYYEFDGTIPQGVINEVLAGNNAEETARIVAQTQVAMKKQYATGVIVGREQYVEALVKVRDAFAMGC